MNDRENKSIKRKPRGIVRRLDPSDPRSLDHPCHNEQWLELARALGRAMADEDFDAVHGKNKGSGHVPI
jgi:hypothetical protein